MLVRVGALLAAMMLPAPLPAAQSDAALRAGLQTDLSQYLAARAKAEHISAISLSISLSPSEPNINVAAGTTQYGGAGAPVTPASLFQIGSNTKSFTSAAILQLEAEGKLDINQRVGQWLPQYPAWKDVPIRRLLNMTSGIPTYDVERSMLSAYAADPDKDWSASELIAYVYPQMNPRAGWLYSNTAYLMSQLIIEHATDDTYAREIGRRFLANGALGLTSTYYEPNLFPADVTNRMVSGYFFSTDADNAGLEPLYGKDMRTLGLSWAQAAGGIVSTPEDVTRWCRALYEGSVLPSKQRAELMTLVSQETGKPLAMTTPQESRGFGLGVGEMLAPKLGRIWFYEGMTLGYRMAYAYFPESHVIFAVGLNSQPDKKQDDIGKLMGDVYDRLHAAGKL